MTSNSTIFETTIWWQNERTVETRVYGSCLVPSPLVSTICETLPSIDVMRDLYQISFEGDQTSLNETFDLQEMWDQDTLFNPQKTQFQWREFSSQDGAGVLVGFILGWNGTQWSQGRANVSVVSVCPMIAEWLPTTLYVIPMQQSTVLSNLSNNPDFGRSNPVFKNLHISPSLLNSR